MYEINSKTFSFSFATNVLFLGFILDWDKYIAPWQTCFIWGIDLRLKSFCIRLTTVLCSDTLLILYHLHRCNLGTFSRIVQTGKHLYSEFNPLNAKLNPICYLLALLAHHFLHVSRIRVKSLTLRLLMSYIYIYIWSAYS